MLFLRNQTQAKSFQGAPELSGEDRGFGSGVIVEAGIGGVQHNLNRAGDFPSDRQRHGQHGFCAIFRQARIAGHVYIVDENRTPISHRFRCNVRIRGLQLQSSKALRLKAIRFRPDQTTFGRMAPEINAARVKEFACQATERLNDVAGISVIEGGARQFQQELLESLVRMRRRFRCQRRIFRLARQLAPSAS